MKRHQKRAILVMILISVGMLATIGVTFFAPKVSFFQPKVEIQSHHFDATVLEDGRMHVKETIDYDLDDKNGVIREYKYDGGKDEQMEIISVTDESGKPFENISEDGYATKDAYSMHNAKYMQILTIYRPTDGKITINIEYIVSGVMKDFSDMQEIYWQFYSTTNDTLASKNVKVTVNFPESMNTDKMELFGHGDLEGNLEKTSAHKVTVDVPFFPEGTFGEVRLLMPEKPLKTFAGPMYPEPKYEEAHAYEIEQATITDGQVKVNAKKANQKEFWRMIVSGVDYLIAIAALLIGWQAFFEMKRRFDTDDTKMELDYYRDLPTAYGPAVAALVADRSHKPDQNQLTAILFSLYMKDFIVIDLQKDLEHLDEEKMYITVLSKQRNTLREEEKELYDWLKNFRGFNERFSYDEFMANTKETKTLKNSKQVVEAYNRVMRKVEISYHRLDYTKIAEFGTVKGRKIIPVLAFISFAPIIALYFVIGMHFILLFYALLTVLIYCISDTLTTYIVQCFKYTKEGVEENAKMNGLKRYLEDYSMLNEANPSLINLWEQYFVFGLSLGVTEKALKALYQSIPNISENYGNQFTHYDVMSRVLLYHNLNYYHQHAIQGHQDRVNADIASKVSASTSRTSGGSSFGGGGGFSGGGGFGSGGGGGRSF